MGSAEPAVNFTFAGGEQSTTWEEGAASAANNGHRTVLCQRGSERSDSDHGRTRHGPGVWSRDRCLTVTALGFSVESR